jgi:pimeloyl-ACP methyl ester carboxylesterase
VNAVERGAGPAVVLVHGLPGTAYDWEPLTAALASRGRRVLAYDRVGFGYSDPRPGDDFTMEGNGRELVGLLESEGLRDATVVGWSYGGGTAMHAALQDPSRIGRLVLVGSAGPLDTPPPGGPLDAVVFSRPVLGWLRAVPPAGAAVRRAFSIEAFSGQPMPDWWLPQLGASLAAPHALDTLAEENGRFRWDGPDPAPIDRPVLIVHGDDDRLVPLAVGEALHARARRSELFVVPGGSHMLPSTHAALVADRIVAFSTGVAADGRARPTAPPPRSP